MRPCKGKDYSLTRSLRLRDCGWIWTILLDEEPEACWDPLLEYELWELWLKELELLLLLLPLMLLS